MEDNEKQKIVYRVIYSSRRTLGISIHPDASVIIRAPYRTSENTIKKLIEQKKAWIIRHTDEFRRKVSVKISYADGTKHLFRGKECTLRLIHSPRCYCRFYGDLIEVGHNGSDNQETIKKILYQGYRKEAAVIFPARLKEVLLKYSDENFRPSGLSIKTMKTRWGSCSSKGKVTLNTELVRLPDIYTEYVIIHELCHLKHHNHGQGFYNLLSGLFPEWKKIRKELRSFICH